VDRRWDAVDRRQWAGGGDQLIAKPFDLLFIVSRG